MRLVSILFLNRQRAISLDFSERRSCGCVRGLLAGELLPAADDDGVRFHVFLGALTPCFNFAGV